MINELVWEDFKNFVDRKGLLVTKEKESRGYGFFIAVDGPIAYRCRISIDRAIYKEAMELVSDSPHSQKISGVVEPDGLHARFIGAFIFDCNPGNEKTEDFILEDDRIFDGVMYEAKGNFNDTVTFQVVHPVYGLIDEFAKDFLITSNPVTIRVYKADLQAGLILRVIYKNNGSEISFFKANFFLHEKK